MANRLNKYYTWGTRMVINKLWHSIFIFLLSVPCYAIDIYAHRGGAGLAPENTLPAIRTALKIGVDVVDVDIGLTKDNVVVAHHDLALNKNLTRDDQNEWLTTPGPALKTLNYQDLSKYNVGSRNPNCLPCLAEFPLQYQYPQAKIPTLKEVIALLKNSNTPTRLQIEIKTSPTHPQLSPEPEAIVPALVAVLREENFLHEVEVHSFDWRNLLLLQKLAPEIITSYLSDHDALRQEDNFPIWLAHHDIVALGTSYPQLIHRLGGKIWCPSYTEITAPLLQEAHNLGLKVNVWTVDQPKEMQTMIDLGVDGIITNRPDILRGLLAAREAGGSTRQS